VRVRHIAIGVNFVDTYQRSGLYPMQLPQVAGNEGAGVVEAVGPDVAGVKKGDRVAYTGLPGSYCEVRVVPADRLLKIPDGITDEQAASMMLKVGTVGSEEKAKLAKDHGADHVINYSKENFVERVGAISGGKKLPVVYDAVGKTTWDGSLDCLRPRGLMVSFGNASGPVPPVNLGILSTKGSLYVTRPTLATHIASRADLLERAHSLFEVVKSGKVKIETTRRYRLAEAQQAHRDLESRKTTGSIILVP
jgi:NADPH2:quinone reductase